MGATAAQAILIFVNFSAPLVCVKGLCRQRRVTSLMQSLCKPNLGFVELSRRKSFCTNFVWSYTPFFLADTYTHGHVVSSFTILWRKQWRIVILFVNNNWLVYSVSALFEVMGVWCKVCSRVACLHRRPKHLRAPFLRGQFGLTIITPSFVWCHWYIPTPLHILLKLGLQIISIGLVSWESSTLIIVLDRRRGFVLKSQTYLLRSACSRLLDLSLLGFSNWWVFRRWLRLLA